MAYSPNTRLADDVGVAITSLGDGGTENGLAVAHVATDFVFSTVNTSTAQLASGATFNGQAETVINQEAVSLLFIADQTCTVTVRQWISASAGVGSGLVSSFSFVQQAGAGLSRAFVANGNYISVHVTNNGAASTTTLNLNVAYGKLPAQTGLGNDPVSLMEVNGFALSGDPVGAVPTADPPTTLFYEDFTTALDTTNKWTSVGTAFTSTGGLLTLPTTAVAGSVTTIPTFSIQASQHFQCAWNVRLEATAATGTSRFWGLGTPATTPAIQSLAQEGAGFQMDTTGVLQAVTYTGGAKTVIATITRPFDNAYHRYGLYFRGALSIWTLDGVEVARASMLNIATQTVSSTVSYYATGQTITGTPQTVVAAHGVGDRSRLHTYIADPTYPWRRAKIDAVGALSVNMSSSQGNVAASTGTLTAAGANNPGVASTTTTTGQVVANVTTAGNATFHLVAAAFVGTVIFEGSLDGGLNYAPVMAIREDGTGSETGSAISVASAFIRTYTAGMPGFTHFRVRASAFTSGTLAVYIAQGPFLIETNPSLGASSNNIGNVKPVQVAAATMVNVSLAVTSFAVLLANTLRSGVTIYNDSTNVVYLAFAATASTTSYTVQIAAGGYYELPVAGGIYTGALSAIATTASGSLRVTEW